ncbi:uncharacterized protein LOC106058762 isoform X2 [Biomphalaria glabrata]|uniref:Uncharacterized protein LOC106058762 isoform X2 n=1 Tax=Biomphalaria glabrata TaxID=6526 RepID=A0A9W2ZAQ5_BIOGL|nr:uncharacterized protein LOC106058762 isoform X2 [Biomphalaria glabrata]
MCDIIAQISGFFGGKNRRKDVDLSSAKNQDNMTIGELIAEKFRRKSESALSIEDLVNKKKNVAVKANGINLVRIGKLDFKLNLIKRLSLSDDVPPALPVRHFRVDSEDDLPPPIPERKSSLDNLIDEGFQRRFTFRPIATVPLPEPLSGIRKIYPSQTPRRNVLQRPPSQPPPPPPPPTSSDSSSPPHPVISFTLYPRPSSQYDYDDDFDDDDFPPPPPLSPSGEQTPTSSPTSSSKKTGMLLKSSSTSSCSKLSNEPPPPPARPLPPPPPQSKKTDAKYKSSPNLIPFEPPKHVRQTFQSTAKEMKLLKLKAAKSEPSLDALDTAPSSPPPLPSRPTALTPALPQKPNYLVKNKGASKTQENKTGERPKLPMKPAQNGNRSPPTSSTSVAKKAADISPKNKAKRNEALPVLTPPVARASPPTPKGSPATGAHKNRPLPAPPKKFEEEKWGQLKGKVGGLEIYDPREEDGDLYDVMEITNI